MAKLERLREARSRRLEAPFHSTIKYVIVPYMNPLLPRSAALARTFPAILQRAGKNALFAADEFFSARLSNPHTRRAYARPVGVDTPHLRVDSTH